MTIDAFANRVFEVLLEAELRTPGCVSGPRVDDAADRAIADALAYVAVFGTENTRVAALRRLARRTQQSAAALLSRALAAEQARMRQAKGLIVDEPTAPALPAPALWVLLAAAVRCRVSMEFEHASRGAAEPRVH